MTRKRIKHRQIPNESKRNSVYRNRVDGFLKKAKELSTLCGIDVAIVVHKQGGENNAVLWPSPPTFIERMNKFLEFSTIERNKRLVTHAKFMEQMTSSATQSLLNFRKKIVDMESHQLMSEFTQGKNLNAFDWYQLHCLSSLADDVVKNVAKAEDEITEEQQDIGGEASALDLGGIGVAAQTSATVVPAESLLENLRNDKWFTETMSEEQGLINFFEAPLLPDAGGTADVGDMQANSSKDYVP